MPQSEPIDFWFSIGSMFTFLTVMRIDRVEDTTDIRFVWRPFSVKAIMIEMDNRPVSKPRKLEYLWRDLHRRAEMYGFAFEGEAPYPLKELRSRQPRRGGRRARRGGAPTMCARPTGAGSSRNRNAGWSRTCPTACARSARIRAAFSRSRRRKDHARLRGGDRRGAAARAFSARRPSLRAAKCSGATTGSPTPSPGINAARSARRARHEPVLDHALTTRRTSGLLPSPPLPKA